MIDASFEEAADAIVGGDEELLRGLIRRDANLPRARSARSHHATLLHYTAANGVEDYRQKTPPNVTAIAQSLLTAGAQVDAVADIYGGSTTLSLAASSVHPQRARVQLPLLQLLLDHGAAIDGVAGSATPILAALRNGRGEAARFLADRGAALDLESAAGSGRLDQVRSFLAAGNAGAEQRAAALAWACEYGYVDVVDVLLDAGGDLNGSYGGHTPLHWAAMNAQTAVADLLVRRGASVRSRNRYGATPSGQALWSAEQERAADRFEGVIALLGAAEE